MRKGKTIEVKDYADLIGLDVETVKALLALGGKLPCLKKVKGEDGSEHYIMCAEVKLW